MLGTIGGCDRNTYDCRQKRILDGPKNTDYLLSGKQVLSLKLDRLLKLRALA